METSATPADVVRRSNDAEAARTTLRWLVGFGLVLHVLGWAFVSSAADAGAGHSTLVYGWLLTVLSACALVVALVGYGVALGIRAARDDTTQPAA